MKISQEIQKELKRIKEDCIGLKKEKQLTEYGRGQLDLIKIIESENNS